MEQKTDRRARKTKAQLRAGLAKLMQNKSIKEITVKELVEEVDINRSTFYLHYTDIYNMLEVLENELLGEILHAIDMHPVSPFSENSLPFIEDIFRILEENKDICSALLGPCGDIAFVHRIERLLADKSLAALRETFPGNIKEVNYSFAFCLSGCVGLIKAWLREDDGESPERMAQLIFHFIMNVVKETY